jgi:hypothetical protein
MGRMSDEDRTIFENAIYFPMLLTVLERDLKAAEAESFKIKTVYLNLIEHTMKKIQKDMSENTWTMYKAKMKLIKGENDGTFTEYNFYYKGYHEVRKYWNANLRNNSEKLLTYYLVLRED